MKGWKTPRQEKEKEQKKQKFLAEFFPVITLEQGVIQLPVKEI